jgi:hypothetical protein
MHSHCFWYDSRICISASASGSAFRTVQYTAAFEFFFGALVKKLLGGQIRVQYSNPDLPGLIHSHPGIAFAGRKSYRKIKDKSKSGLKRKIFDILALLLF